MSTKLNPIAIPGFEEATTGQVLKKSGSTIAWGDGGSGGSTTLSGLEDTNISSPANNQVLAFDSTQSKWINGLPTASMEIVESSTFEPILSYLEFESGTVTTTNNSLTWETDNSRRSYTMFEIDNTQGGTMASTVEFDIQLKNPYENYLMLINNTGNDISLTLGDITYEFGNEMSNLTPWFVDEIVIPAAKGREISIVKKSYGTDNRGVITISPELSTVTPAQA